MVFQSKSVLNSRHCGKLLTSFHKCGNAQTRNDTIQQKLLSYKNNPPFRWRMCNVRTILGSPLLFMFRAGGNSGRTHNRLI